MKKENKIYQPVSPRLAGAIFFALFALLCMLFIKYTLLSIQESALLPLFTSILAAIGTGASAGAFFGGALAKKARWPRPFFLGVAVGLLALVLIAIRLFIFSYSKNPLLFDQFHSWQQYLVFYGALLASLLLTLGLWLLPLTGLIAIYFNKQFYPNLLLVDKDAFEKKQLTKTDTTHD